MTCLQTIVEEVVVVDGSEWLRIRSLGYFSTTCGSPGSILIAISCGGEQITLSLVDLPVSRLTISIAVRGGLALSAALQGSVGLLALAAFRCCLGWC